MAPPQDAEGGYYTKDAYCATCHYKYDKEIEKHAKHKPGTVQCDDCHRAQTVADGARYSIHDHMFDFSQSEVACGECHEAGDERLNKPPQHAWSFDKVKKPLTLEQNCVRCHGEKEAGWIQEKLKGIKRRL